MNSGIKYCSLEEAWGPVFSGRYNQDISYNGALVPFDTVQATTVDEFEQYTRPPSDDIRRYLKEEEDDKTTKACDLFMKHFYDCDKCQELILRKCKKKLKKKRDLNEGFMNFDDGNSNNNNYTDIVVMLLVGVFIILVLDSILKMGKRMNG